MSVLFLVLSGNCNLRVVIFSLFFTIFLKKKFKKILKKKPIFWTFSETNMHNKTDARSSFETNY